MKWESLCARIHREFSHESIGERILKIGPHLPKLLSNIKGFTFSGPSVYNMVRHILRCQRYRQLLVLSAALRVGISVDIFIHFTLFYGFWRLKKQAAAK